MAVGNDHKTVDSDDESEICPSADPSALLPGRTAPPKIPEQTAESPDPARLFPASRRLASPMPYGLLNVIGKGGSSK